MPQLDTAKDPWNLRRFVDAQESTFEQARSELAEGQKRSHWMWFIFPQVRGLGSSPMAQRYALSSLDEATAYLMHPVLGQRLRDCTGIVNSIQGRSIDDIFGHPDDLKFHSSVTLFARAVSHALQQISVDDQVFLDALAKYFDGQPDRATLGHLES